MTDTPDKNDTPSKTEKVIEAFGGIRPMAKHINVPVTTVQYWKKVGHIPARAHADILDAARGLGLNIEPADLVAPDGTKTDEPPELPVSDGNGLEVAPVEPVAEAPVPEPPPVLAPTSQPAMPETPIVEPAAPKPLEPDPVKPEPVKPEPVKPPEPESPSAAQPAAVVKPVGKSSATPIALLALAVAVLALAAPALRAPISALLGSATSQTLFGPNTAGRVSTVEGRVAKLEARMAEADGTVRKTSEMIDRLGSDVPSMLARMDVLERGTKSLLDDLTALKKSLGTLQLDQATSPTDLGPRMVSVEQKLTEMSTVLDGIGGLVRDADPQGVAKLTASVGNIQDLLGRLAGDVDGLKGAVQSADARAAALGARLDEKSNRNHASDAMLLGALRLEAALRRPGPYAADLALVRGLGALDSNFGQTLDVLSRYAETGVPTAPDLREQLKSAVPRILAAGTVDGATWTERTLDTLAGLVAMRRIPGAVEGDSVDAILARAEARMEALDLAGAVAEVGKLPPPHGDVAAAWLASARARLEMDAAAARLVGQALTRLLNQPAN